MTNNSEIERLRAEVRRAHAAANRKVSRLRNEKGVELSGSPFDLRRDINKVKRYNKQQLNNYLRELTTFTHRSTQYVAGAQGTPIPKKDWDRYKALESQFNKVAQQHIDSVANQHNPIVNMTVRKADATYRADRIFAAGEAANRPYEVRVREARHVKGAAGVAALHKALEKKLKPGYYQTSVKDGRAQANKMLKVMGASELRRDIRKLSDYQFDVLWNYMKLADALSAKYEIARKTNVDEERWEIKQYRDKAADVDELIKFARENIREPETKPGKRK